MRVRRLCVVSLCVWLFAAGGALRCHFARQFWPTPSPREWTRSAHQSAQPRPLPVSRAAGIPSSGSLPVRTGKPRSHSRRVSRVCVLIGGCSLNASTRTPTREIIAPTLILAVRGPRRSSLSHVKGSGTPVGHPRRCPEQLTHELFRPRCLKGPPTCRCAEPANVRSQEKTRHHPKYVLHDCTLPDT